MVFPLVKNIKVDGILAFLQAPQVKFTGLWRHILAFVYALAQCDAS